MKYCIDVHEVRSVVGEGGGSRTVVALLCGAGSATRLPPGSAESNCADVALRRRVAAICGRLRAH